MPHLILPSFPFNNLSFDATKGFQIVTKAAQKCNTFYSDYLLLVQIYKSPQRRRKT